MTKIIANKKIVLTTAAIVLSISIALSYFQSKDINSQIRINQNLGNNEKLFEYYKENIKSDSCNQILHYKLLTESTMGEHNISDNIKDYYKSEGDFENCIEIYYYANGFINQHHNKKYDEAKAFYFKAASSSNPYMGAYNSLGYLHQFELEDIESAIKFYEKSIALYPKLGRAVNNLIGLYLSQGKYENILALINNKDLNDTIYSLHKFGYYKAVHNYFMAALYYIDYTFRYMTKLSILSALILMIFWFLLIYKFDTEKPKPKIYCGLAIFLGFCSVFLTVFLHSVTPEIPTIHPILYNFLLYFLKVGPIEEISKILLLIIFINLFKFRDKPLDILIYGGLIALGFATIENMQYFSFYGLDLVFSRFIFSVLLHISLTGILSFGIYQYYSEQINLLGLLKIFVIISALHASYDFVLSLLDYSIYLGVFRLLMYISYGIIALPIKYYINLVVYCLNKFRTDEIKIKNLSHFYLVSVLISWSMAFVFSTYSIGLTKTIESSFFHIIFSYWVIAYTYNIFSIEVKDTPQYLSKLFNLEIFE